MRKTITALLFTTAAMLMLVFATTATASRSIGFNPNATQASGELTFQGANGNIICNVTLLRTISRAIPKIRGTLMGRITGVAIDYGVGPNGEERCRHSFAVRNVRRIIALRIASAESLEPDCRIVSGTIRLCDVSGSEARLWKLIYEGFSGTLPEITAIRFEIGDVQFKIEFQDAFAVVHQCLYRGTIPVRANVVRRVISTADGEGALVLFKDLTRNCETASLRGNFAVNPAVTISLL